MARLRRSSRTIALLVLASFWGLSHWAGDDACGAFGLQAHDESKHVIGAPGAGDPDHCAVCHSIRSPRRPFGPAAQLHALLIQGAVVDPVEPGSRRPPTLENLPARAPPATLT